MAYRMESSENEGIILWIEAPCGIKQPLMHWANLAEVRRFGEIIIGYCDQRQMTNEAETEDRSGNNASIAANLLRQVFNDNDFFSSQAE